MKVISTSIDYSGVQIIQALVTRTGSSLQGFDKLQCNFTAAACTSNDQQAQLEEQFALDRSDLEPKSPQHRQRSAQPVHDITACLEQMDAVYRDVATSR